MYDDTENVRAAEPEPDQRVIAMHRVVDLERQHEAAAHKSERAQKEAAIVKDELRQAREELHSLLGMPSSPSSNARPMSSDEAQKIARAYR